jgi:hypothetical protein
MYVRLGALAASASSERADSLGFHHDCAGAACPQAHTVLKLYHCFDVPDSAVNR